MKRKHFCCKANSFIPGSVSIYLSLILSVIISLLFYTIDSCHINALVAHSNGITYTSLDSLFGQYCIPLFKDYGLFAVNEQGFKLENEIQNYASKNCTVPKSLIGYGHSFLNMSVYDVNVKKITYLTDSDGEEFVNQISEYTKYLEISSVANELLEDSEKHYPEMFKSDENGNIDFSFKDIDASKLAPYISSNSNEDSSKTDTSNIDKANFQNKTSNSIEHIIKNGLLSFIVQDPASVSSKTIDKATLPSVTCQLTDNGIANSYGYYKDIAKATYDKACFCQYISKSFDCYTSPNANNPLEYEMEYIIYGSPDDDTNFINCAMQLLNLRTGLNLVYLLSDSNKRAAAGEIASFTTFVPGLKYLSQMSILTIWATAEAILDVRDLVSGKNVVLIKTDKEWNLSLDGLNKFSKKTPSNNNGKDGLSYSHYLKLLMAKQNNISLYYRTMDLIQLDICARYNSDFRLSKCISSISVNITYNLPCIFISRKKKYICNGHYSYK